MSLGKDQAKTNADLAKGRSDRVQGTCMGVNFPAGLVTVNVRGGTIDMPMVGVAPFVGDAVWVAYVGQMPLCVGSVPKPTTGTVMPDSAPAGFVRVTTDDNVVRQVVYTGSTPPVGSRVSIDWAANGVITGVMSADPPGVDPALIIVPPDQGDGDTGATGGEATFPAVWSGTFYIPGQNWAGAEPYASPNQIGCFGYQGIRETVGGGQIVEARFFWAEYSSPYPTSSTVGVHGQGAPAAVPNLMHGAPMGAGGGWHGISQAGADALKAGTALGIGVTGGGFRRARAAGVENSGALYLRWV